MLSFSKEKFYINSKLLVQYITSICCIIKKSYFISLTMHYVPNTLQCHCEAFTEKIKVSLHHFNWRLLCFILFLLSTHDSPRDIHGLIELVSNITRVSARVFSLGEGIRKRNTRVGLDHSQCSPLTYKRNKKTIHGFEFRSQLVILRHTLSCGPQRIFLDFHKAIFVGKFNVCPDLGQFGISISFFLLLSTFPPTVHGVHKCRVLFLHFLDLGTCLVDKGGYICCQFRHGTSLFDSSDPIDATGVLLSVKTAVQNDSFCAQTRREI
mmetsp:Transcript_14087/g.29156  ORF Transcript_14087/g.29156 Transcript_14087/m.29156 type:complete len:266 (+) Transcript_14087:989-1786(+)